MKKDFQNENRITRFEKRTKRRKTNIILNSLIGIVLLLIIIISVNIFFGDEKASNEKEKNSVENQSNNISQNESVDVEVSNGVEQKESNNEKESEDDKEVKEGEAIITEGGSDSNVEKTIVNPGWNSVGTTQTGEHAAEYDESSVDWKEMLQAISYATGLDQENMTVWYLGNNNHDPQKSIGTVSSKDTKVKYRVYLEWVDEKGWKPSKVEELKDLNIQ